MWTIFFVFITAFLLIAAAGMIFSRSDTHRRLSQIVVSQTQTAVLTSMSAESSVARLEKLLYPFQGMLPRSAKEISNLRKLLARAGCRETRHVDIYYAAKVLAPVTLCLLATFSGSLPLTPLFVYA